MAIKLSGSLSIENDIVPEFITDNATPASLRPHSLSEYYVDGGLVPAASPQNDNIPTSGAISFSDFYGAVNVISVTFFEDPTNTNNNFYIDNNGDSAVVSKGTYVNLYDIADTFIPNVSGEQNVPFEFIIDSDACFNNSIQTGGYFADLTITNKGIIAGRGGDGAGYSQSSPSAGTAAIRILHNSDKITIDNLNGAYIAGGGGGGRRSFASHTTKTAYGGGGGGWNGGNGGQAMVSPTGFPYTQSGGAGVVIKSKTDTSSGGSGTERTEGAAGAMGSVGDAGGGQAGGGAGGALVSYTYTAPDTSTETGKQAAASSGGGGGNKITSTASGGAGGTARTGFGADRGTTGGNGGSNSSNGSLGSAISKLIGTSGVITSGGGGGWAASGGSGAAGGKAVQRTGTVTTLTYTTGPGTYYGTKDT